MDEILTEDVYTNRDLALASADECRARVQRIIDWYKSPVDTPSN